MTTDVDTEDDPLIAALEAQRARLRQADPKPNAVYKNLYAARDRYWQGKIRGKGTVMMFAYTSDRVAREINGKEHKGYASYVYDATGSSLELDLESLKFHKTKREAIARAWDLYCGWRLGRNLGVPSRWGMERR